ncbi:DgyrCDS12882 [Dimorphilus gyrociliatus]|uniref:DgyrCDS12882 n=1 Tax=Dimorphilus gyrociliatus TaxID=2664684 RepID=A0A7I8W904_9ANNE|nr:DgyrCDS12882 [Dimorphilus gyrociliatus]
MKLRIATKSWPAYSAWNENIGNFEGLSIELLKYVMNDLNFTTEKIQTPEDDKWGSLENNTWNGLIKMLMDNKTDAVFAPLTPLKDRQDVMDFSLPYHFVRPMLIFKNHLHENNSNERGEFFFLQPFSNITWILICVSVAVMGFLLMALEKQKSYIFSTEHLFFLGTLFNQGGGYGINSKGYVRIILSGWWIFSITMVAFFSGKIIADLAVYKAKYPFDTLEDLVYSKDYTLITLGDAAYESLLKNSKSWTYQALWAKIAKAARDNPDVRHTDEKVIIQLVLNGGYVFLTGGYEPIINNHPELSIKNMGISFSTYNVGVQKNSYYNVLMSNSILKAQHSGMIGKWKKQFLSTPKLKIFEKTRFKSTISRVSLRDIAHIFYIVILNISASLLTLVLEILLVKLKYYNKYK